MSDTIAAYMARIREMCADLDIQSVTHNSEGLCNDIFIVNGDTVFRFAKDAHAEKVLPAETQILDRIRPRVTLNIPNPCTVGQDVITYPLLPGETLSRNILLSLSKPAQQAVADQLADFLRALHTAPLDETVPPTSAPASYDDWIKIRSQVEEKVYPLLMAHQIAWARSLFDGMLSDRSNFMFRPALIHGDLGP